MRTRTPAPYAEQASELTERDNATFAGASPSPPPALSRARLPSPLVRYRLLLRELDTLLERQPERLLEHPAAGTATSRYSQLLARLAAAWLRIEPAGAEQRAWRTLDLARFCEHRAWLDKLRPEWILPEAWPKEELAALEERARVALGQESPGTA
jgi:hypothetical protein